MANKLLLNLPAEILDVILEHVILSRRTAPVTIAEASKTRNSQIKDTQPKGLPLPPTLKGKSRICYETSSIADTSSSLLLVSKYVHTRTKAILTRLFPHGPGYLLDALFVEERELWPTWLQVSMQSRNVNSVEVMLRVIGNANPGRSLFIGGDASPPQHVWIWYNLLNHFLCHGTKSLGRDDIARIVVRNVNIRVTGASPEIMERDDSIPALQRFQQQQRRFDYEEEEGESVSELVALHPLWLAKLLSREVRHMSTVSYHVAQYSTLMLERVKNIQVTYIAADGSEEVVHHVDLTQELIDMWHGSIDERPWENRAIFGSLPSECRIPTFWNWKLRTLRARQLYFGDPAPQNARWPSLELWQMWQTQLKEYRRSIKAEGRLWTCDGQRCLCPDESLSFFLRELNDSPLHQNSKDQSTR